MVSNPALALLNQLVGSWSTRLCTPHCLVSSRMAPSTWNGWKGNDLSSFVRMHYFDSRGVFRVYETGIDGKSWRLWREAPGFSQRFTGMFADSGNTMAGRWQLREDDIHWGDDLEITYQRLR